MRGQFARNDPLSIPISFDRCGEAELESCWPQMISILQLRIRVCDIRGRRRRSLRESTYFGLSFTTSELEAPKLVKSSLSITRHCKWLVTTAQALV